MRQHPVKLGTDMARNISRLVDKLKEAEDHINTYYAVGDQRGSSQAQGKNRTVRTDWVRADCGGLERIGRQQGLGDEGKR